MKKVCLKASLAGCLCFLLFVAACGSKGETSTAGNPISRQAETTAVSTATSTVSQTGFAATVESSNNPVNREAQGDNLTTIHSAVDRPVAKVTRTTLNVPSRAKGVVVIQNDSANPQTLVSDTAGGFAPFTIAPYTSSSLVFHRTGTFKAHLKDYPPGPDTTITIIIVMPSPD